MRSTLQGLVVIGAGPAGLAPLFAAANSGELDALLTSGVTILEQSQALGSGALGTYAIRSDSSAEALLDIVLRSRDARLSCLRSHPVTQAIAQCGKGSAPLRETGVFLQLAAQTLCEIVASSARGRVLKGVTAHWLQKMPGGVWRTHFTDARGDVGEIDSHSVLVATGAHQPAERLRNELVAGAPLLPTYGPKLMQSGEVFAEGGLARVAGVLQGKPAPKVAIVGGSTSAAALALAMLTRLPEITFGEGGVTLLHRKPLRIFYESVAEALADNYTEFRPDDVCSLTGRVFRLSGFRLDSRELIMRARGIAGRPPEPRLRLLKLDANREDDARRCIDEADLVIAALGYRPRLIPVFNGRMQPIPLLTPRADRWAVVDRRSRLLTADEHPLHGVFALGLAIGPAATPEFGGELDFRGQVNSLWLWQHTLGQSIVGQVLKRERDHRTAEAASQAPVFRSVEKTSVAFPAWAALPQTAGAR